MSDSTPAPESLHGRPAAFPRPFWRPACNVPARRGTVRALREEAVPATMYAVVRSWNTRGTQTRYHFIAVPFIRELLDERYPTGPMKYMLAPEDEPAPPIEKPATRKWGAQPRRGGKEVIPLDE